MSLIIESVTSVCKLSTTSCTRFMFHLLDPPPYSVFTKSQEAAASTSGGGQQIGSMPAPGPPFYTTPNLQPVQQVVMSVYVIMIIMEPLIADPPR